MSAYKRGLGIVGAETTPEEQELLDRRDALMRLRTGENLTERDIEVLRRMGLSPADVSSEEQEEEPPRSSSGMLLATLLVGTGAIILIRKKDKNNQPARK